MFKGLQKMKVFKAVFSTSCLVLACSVMANPSPSVEPPKPGDLPMDIQKPSAFTPEQHRELLTIMEEFIKTNAQSIKQCLEKLIAAEALEEERKQKEIAASLIKANDAAIFKNPSIPVIGNPSGNRVLAIFIDPYCGYCHESLKDLKRFVKEDPQVKILVHDVAILGQPSELAVKALLAARSFGKEENLRELLKEAKTQLDQAGLKDLAKKLGIDGETFTNAMKQESVNVGYETNMKLVNALKLDATPTLIYGTEIIRGYLPLDVLQQKLGMLVTIKDPILPPSKKSDSGA